MRRQICTQVAITATYSRYNPLRKACLPSSAQFMVDKHEPLYLIPSTALSLLLTFFFCFVCTY